MLFVSGGLAALLDAADASGFDVYDLLRYKSALLKVHGAAAMAFMIMFGWMLATHVPAAWAANRNRRSGILMITAIGLLIVTGYGLYYASGEVSRGVIQWSHIGLGAVEPFFLGAHVLLGRRSRPAVLAHDIAASFR